VQKGVLVLTEGVLLHTGNFFALVWYKKEKERKTTPSKSERKTVLLLASFIPG
jgi:hypothetical protein